MACHRERAADAILAWLRGVDGPARRPRIPTQDPDAGRLEFRSPTIAPTAIRAWRSGVRPARDRAFELLKADGCAKRNRRGWHMALDAVAQQWARSGDDRAGRAGDLCAWSRSTVPA